MTIRNSVICGGCWILFALSSASSHEVYLALDGKDSNPGTKDRPVATLVRARDLVRQLKPKAKEPIRVVLRGGTYALDEPLILGADDSGTRQTPIIYKSMPGEKAVISGGKAVTRWRRGPGPLWTAEIPEVKQGKWYFRQLHVNGERRPRARLPQQGYYKVAGPAEPGKRAFKFAPAQIDPRWRNLEDVEILVLQFWSDARMRIASIDRAASIVRFTGDAFRPTSWSRGWYAENVAEGLTQPGQWYLDRATGVLSYWPLPGEEIDKVRIVAPAAKQWLRLDGDFRAGRFIEHLTFRGLAFEYSAWTLGKELGYSYPQASIELTPSKPLWVGWQVDEGPSTPQSQVVVPAAIYARGARHVRFEDCTIAHTGAWAIHFAQGGCRDNAVVGCRFEDLGAGAVRIGGPDTTLDDAEETCRTTVTDNRIHDAAQVYHGAPAVWIGQSSGNRVAHNDITGSCQWAVSVGWNWGYMPPNNARDNVVEYNHCHHLGTGLLGMHGALYFLGVQPGTAARHNLIHHVSGGGSGIVLDNGSVGMVVEHNLVHHTAAHALLFNFNDLGNIIQNNIFALSDDALVNRSGDAGKLDQTGIFYRNIYYWRGDRSRLFHPDRWPNFDLISDFNLYYDASGKPPRLASLSFAEWKQKGLDASSLLADPKFADAERDDFSLAPDSPAFRLGFRPIDLRDVGPRRSGAWQSESRRLE